MDRVSILYMEIVSIVMTFSGIAIVGVFNIYVNFVGFRYRKGDEYKEISVPAGQTHEVCAIVPTHRFGDWLRFMVYITY